ncbi:NB-ARC domain-containing protein [Wolbachia pipientis]|nr:NB-ARC domain-containing protein [Wolbachia pipientis]
MFKKVLKEEVLYEYAKNVIFNEKSSSGLDDVSERNVLVNKVVESLESSKKVDEDVIEKLGRSIIILDTKNKQLKFADQEKIKDESAKQFIRDLKSKVSKLADYKFDIPYELVKKVLKEQTEKETLKLHVDFGNISPSFKKPEHLIKKLVELFEEYKFSKIIKIDDNIVGHGKSLTVGDIKNIGKLVGNLLIFDKKKKMLKLAEGSFNGDTLEFITNLKSTAQSKSLDVFSYRFDIKVKNFPRETLVTDDEDRTNVKEFLNKLEVLTGQASDLELKEIIKDEIRNLYKLTEEEAKESFLKVRDKAEEHWRKGEYYLEKGDDFFVNIVKFNIRFDVKDPVTLFTGRIRELEDLHKILQEGGEAVVSQMASITGLGGIGKSALARKYAYDHRNDYDGNVIWINAESYQTLVKSFLRLAQDKLGINVKSIEGNQKDIKSVVEDVYGFFSNRKSLFIFDNAEKCRTREYGNEGIDKFLPSLPSSVNKPYVLITSRNQEWGDIQPLTLGIFTESESIDFIRKALGIKDESQENEIMKNLAEILQHFPLALQQAVAYIKERDKVLKNVGSKFKISDYFKRYDEETKKLLDFKFPDSSRDLYSKTVFTTWRITVDEIKENNEYGKQAGEILDIIAYFAPDNIPVQMFLGSELIGDDKEKLGDAVQLLKQYSMVNSEQEQTLNVHKLVQQVTRINLMDKKREEETLRKALELIKSDNSEKKVKVHLSVFFILVQKMEN